MAAGYFTAEEVEKAEEAIRAMMRFSGGEEKEEEGKLTKIEGGKDEQEVRQRILANFPCQHLGKLLFLGIVFPPPLPVRLDAPRSPWPPPQVQVRRIRRALKGRRQVPLHNVKNKDRENRSMLKLFFIVL